MGSEKSQFDRMMEVARERLARHAPEELAQRAGVEYADGAFIVSTLGKTVRAAGVRGDAAAAKLAHADAAALS